MRERNKYDRLSQSEFTTQAQHWDPDPYKRISIHHGFPVKPVLLAVFLLSMGILLLSFGILMHNGHIKNGGDVTKGYGLIFLGCLTFLPGFYESRIAYYTWRGTPGYSYNMIPNM